MTFWLRGCVLMTGLCAFAPEVPAEIYTWTDRDGSVHMTDDASEVPPNQRSTLKKQPELPELPSWKQRDLTTRRKPAAGVARAVQDPAAPRRHVLRVSSIGREMKVSATIDGVRGLPFIVDTGAMGNTIPGWAVAHLGIKITKDLRTIVIGGIGGVPMTVPVISVGRVQIGTAVVEDVEFAVLNTMREGLLGMEFFNHFKVQTDPVAGTLTLEEIDLDAVEGVHGGLGEEAWRAKFRSVHRQLNKLDAARDAIPSEFETSSASFRDYLDERGVYWQRQLEDLEDKATRAEVPPSWRWSD